MPWYKSGLVSVVLNSNAVIGTGTAFIANSRVGDAFRGPDGAWYEVTNIASDTAMSISPNYQGVTNAAGTYALAPMQGYVKDSADALRALVNQYGAKMAALGTTGNYDVLPVTKGGTGGTDSGTALTGLGFSDFSKTLIYDANAADARATLVAAKSGQNADITELSGLTKPITTTQGGVDPGYIQGLIPAWVTATEISITAGSAYIPSLGRCITAQSVSLPGLSVAGNSWYYLYLYDNAGVPTYELSTTAPAAPYSGTARTKAGVNSRRFICALRTGNSALRPFLWAADYVNYMDSATLYLILSASTQVGPISVSAAAAMPPTTRRALMQVYSAVGNTFNMGIAFDTMLLSVQAATRVLAPVISLADQVFVYGHVGAVTGGTSLDVRGYGSER